MELVTLSKDGNYSVSADPDLIVTEQLAGADAAKSFQLDHYYFDSSSERPLFWNLLRAGKVKKLYFTGMLTHDQSDFYYINPDTHVIHSYYPGFLVGKDNNTYVIIEVKGDHKIEDPVVQAKRAFAGQIARDNQMTIALWKTVEPALENTVHCCKRRRGDRTPINNSINQRSVNTRQDHVKELANT